MVPYYDIPYLAMTEEWLVYKEHNMGQLTHVPTI